MSIGLESSIKLRKDECFELIKISIKNKTVIGEKSTKTYPNFFIRYCNLRILLSLLFLTIFLTLIILSFFFSPKFTKNNFNTISNIIHDVETFTWTIISLSYLIDQFSCVSFPILLEVYLRILNESLLIKTFF